MEENSIFTLSELHKIFQTCVFLLSHLSAKLWDVSYRFFKKWSYRVSIRRVWLRNTGVKDMRRIVRLDASNVKSKKLILASMDKCTQQCVTKATES